MRMNHSNHTTRLRGVWLAAAAAVALVAADAASTWLLLTHGGPTLREADPVVAGILARWGWGAFFAADALRAAVVVVGMLLLAAATKRRPLLRTIILAAVLGVLVYP